MTAPALPPQRDPLLDSGEPPLPEGSRWTSDGWVQERVYPADRAILTRFGSDWTLQPERRKRVSRIVAIVAHDPAAARDEADAWLLEHLQVAPTD